MAASSMMPVTIDDVGDGWTLHLYVLSLRHLESPGQEYGRLARLIGPGTKNQQQVQDHHLEWMRTLLSERGVEAVETTWRRRSFIDEEAPKAYGRGPWHLHIEVEYKATESLKLFGF